MAVTHSKYVTVDFAEKTYRESDFPLNTLPTTMEELAEARRLFLERVWVDREFADVELLDDKE